MMIPKKLNFRFAVLPLILVILLSCMGMAEKATDGSEPFTSDGEESRPSTVEEPKSTGAEKRESAADEAADSTWSEESEAQALAEGTPAEKAAPAGTTRSATAAGRSQASGLKAGFADDNKQFN